MQVVYVRKRCLVEPSTFPLAAADCMPGMPASVLLFQLTWHDNTTEMPRPPCHCQVICCGETQVQRRRPGHGSRTGTVAKQNRPRTQACNRAMRHTTEANTIPTIASSNAACQHREGHQLTRMHAFGHWSCQLCSFPVLHPLFLFSPSKAASVLGSQSIEVSLSARYCPAYAAVTFSILQQSFPYLRVHPHTTPGCVPQPHMLLLACACMVSHAVVQLFLCVNHCASVVA